MGGNKTKKALPPRLRRPSTPRMDFTVGVAYERSVWLQGPGFRLPLSDDETTTSCASCHRAVRVAHINRDGACILCAPRKTTPAVVVRSTTDQEIRALLTAVARAVKGRA